MKDIISIYKPQIRNVKYPAGETARLEALIRFGDEEPVLAFTEVMAEYSCYLCEELIDAFVVLCIPIAIREGKDIQSDYPISEQLLHNINECLLPTLAHKDPNCFLIKVDAPAYRGNPIHGDKIGTGVSTGVDSLYTIQKYTSGQYSTMQLDYLFIGPLSKELWDIDVSDNLFTWIDKHPNQFERYDYVSKKLDLPVIALFSNFLKIITKRECVERHVRVHEYITMGAVLTLKKLWRGYYFSATVPYSYFILENHLVNDMTNYELLMMHTLTIDGFFCYAGGAGYSRVLKMKAVADNTLAQATLHPCQTQNRKNCSSEFCDKCLCGLLTLDYFDQLDLMSDVYDIKKYKNNRMNYLERLVVRKDNKFFIELFELFTQKYPEDMNEAIKRAEKNEGLMKKKKYKQIKYLYDCVLKLLQLDDGKSLVINYFVDNGYKKIYYVGNSEFGELIMSYLKGKIEISEYHHNKHLDYDEAVYVMDVDPSDIDKIVRYIPDCNNIILNQDITKIILTEWKKTHKVGNY